jgi:hypothetical protein
MIRTLESGIALLESEIREKEDKKGTLNIANGKQFLS